VKGDGSVKSDVNSPMKPITKTYTNEFPGGSKMDATMSVDLTGRKNRSAEEIVGVFAECCHDFYMHLANQINSKRIIQRQINS
jgi:hypothetical protein